MLIWSSTLLILRYTYNIIVVYACCSFVKSINFFKQNKNDCSSHLWSDEYRNALNAKMYRCRIWKIFLSVIKKLGTRMVYKNQFLLDFFIISKV